MIVVDKIAFDEIKTKNMVNVLANLKAEKAYVVIDGNDKNVVLSSKNIPTMKLASSGTLCVYDILKYNKLVLTQDAVKTIEEVFA